MNNTMNPNPTDKIQALLAAASKRISPSDGMAITADVWAESHDFHRVTQQLHLQHAHAPGILAGLEVLATEPPSEKVVVMPGAALDDEGHLIVLHEPHKFNVSVTDGNWPRLLLSYDESQPPQPDLSPSRAELNVKHIHHHNTLNWFSRDASQGQVELARVRVTAGDANTATREAKNPLQPGLFEIDLRFRAALSLSPKAPASIAVAAIGARDAAEAADSLHGVCAWAAGLNRTGKLCVGVDEGVALDGALKDYTGVMLHAYDPTQITSAMTDALHDYVLTRGGTLWVEGMRGQQNTAALRNLFNALALPLVSISSDHEMMRMPHVFGVPPQGYDGAAPQVFVGNGVVLCESSYSLVWQGLLHTGPASRQIIRDAVEFGENGLAFALRRRGYEV